MGAPGAIFCLCAYDPELRLWILGRKEGTPVRVEGDVRSSGSGEMYVLVRKIEEA